ncbi:MAG: hypothetical protein K2I00_11145 [Ruminococcus sp.]|nr:hypothetical protein [Ruminococcus sp.]
MEKMIITQYSRAIALENVDCFFRRTIGIFCDDTEKRTLPYALFALMKSGEIVNIGNFCNYDIAEIIAILLDIFKYDGKNIFNVNLETHGITEVLTLLEYVTGSFYHTAVEDLKISLANGDIDVSFS